MKRGQQRTGAASGFTIVETMIVLAVTGLLFVMIAVSWSGRQHVSEFKTAANEVRSQVQQAISDVQNGYFPGNGGFSCSPGTNNLTLKSVPVGSPDGSQGTNDACVFLGKLVLFGNNNATADGFRLFSVAGLRNPTNRSSFALMQPTVLAPSGNNDTMIDLTNLNPLHYGLTVASMQATSGGPQPVNAIAFLSKNGALSAQDDMESGSQPIELYAFNIPDPDLQAGTGNIQLKKLSDSLNAKLISASGVYKNVPVRICLKSGGTNQFAILSLGVGSRQLQAQLQIQDSCT